MVCSREPVRIGGVATCALLGGDAAPGQVLCDPEELKNTVVCEGRHVLVARAGRDKGSRLGGLTTDTSQFLGLEVQSQGVDRVSSRAVRKDLLQACLLALSVAVLLCLSIVFPPGVCGLCPNVPFL